MEEKGASLHYASNFQIKAYEFEAEFFEKNEIVCHPPYNRKISLQDRQEYAGSQRTDPNYKRRKD